MTSTIHVEQSSGIDPKSRLLNFAQAVNALGLKIRTATRMRERGEFPLPTIDSKNGHKRWSVRCLEEWVKNRDYQANAREEALTRTPQEKVRESKKSEQSTRKRAQKPISWETLRDEFQHDVRKERKGGER